MIYNNDDINYNFLEIHPVIAYRTMQNIGFRLFKCIKTNNILMENSKSWINNLKLNKYIKEDIKHNFNNTKVLIYLQNIVNFVNKNNSLFESEFIKNTTIETESFNKYVTLKTNKKKFSYITKVLLIENLINEKLNTLNEHTDSITDSILNSPFYDITKNYVFQNYNFINTNLDFSYNYFNKLVKKF